MALVQFLILFVFACSSSDPSSAIVLVSDPSSLLAGESITATVTSSRDFFEADLASPIISEGGLILESLTMKSATEAVATLRATDADIGLHRFALGEEGHSAYLDISVMNQASGQGTISSSNAQATAGAFMATLTIEGEGTNFDSMVEVEVEDADGFEVLSTILQTEGWLDVIYNIDITQEPAQATVIVKDGAQTYELPFTILSPAEYTTTVADQTLTKGRVGELILKHPDASMHLGTHFNIEGQDVEAGDPDVVDETEVHIPVRVPFDTTGSVLNLTAYTYSQGGAVLELMNIDATLLEPAYVAVTPSRLTNTPGLQTVGIVASGLDLTAIDDFYIESASHISLSAWSAADSDSGTATFALDSSTASGGYSIFADDGYREIAGTIAVEGFGKNLFESEEDVRAGDHLFATFVVYGGDLVDGDITLQGDDDIEAVDFIYIDEGCVVVELEIDPYANDGLAYMTLSSNGEDYNVYLNIEESGI